MNRIDQLFKNKRNVLTIFFTAGFPELGSTKSILKSLQNSAVDMIEIGIPFSDPVADGPVIQKANLEAINNGMTVEKLFSQLEGFREEISIPVVIMSSFNPILRFGVKAFCEQCKVVGIDGLIIPDLPSDFFEKNYANIFREMGLINVNLITPTTPSERIKMIDEKSCGFIYLVSSSSTTGGNGSFSEEQKEYFKSIRDSQLRTPVLTGFGISDQESFETVCSYTDGGIIGSAFIRSLSENGHSESSVHSFIRSIRK